jgi:hypothetical protein
LPPGGGQSQGTWLGVGGPVTLAPRGPVTPHGSVLTCLASARVVAPAPVPTAWSCSCSRILARAPVRRKRRARLKKPLVSKGATALRARRTENAPWFKSSRKRVGEGKKHRRLFSLSSLRARAEQKMRLLWLQPGGGTQPLVLIFLCDTCIARAQDFRTEKCALAPAGSGGKEAQQEPHVGAGVRSRLIC